MLLFAACSSQPRYIESRPSAPQQNRATSQPLIAHALEQRGTAYRYGGSHPATGFDCSGLIQFSYLQVGKRIPRTTRAQYQASRPVPLGRIRPGDLLFYQTEGRKPGHVALYLGRGEMIHAPSSGKHVLISRLDNPYWRKRLIAAGRF